MNQKGGTAKTTTTINLAAGLALLKHKVLVIDLDPQANATTGFGLPDNLEKTIYEVFKSLASKGSLTISDTINKINDRIDIVPASLDLSAVEMELSQIPGRDLLLRRAIKDLDYEYVLFDCPPNLSFLTVNALAATDEVLVPTQAEKFPVSGMIKLMATIELITELYNSDLNLLGIVVTQYSQTTLHRETYDMIKEIYKDQIMNTIIRKNVHLAESQSFGQDIFTYKEDSNGAEDYLNLTREVLERVARVKT